MKNKHTKIRLTSEKIQIGDKIKFFGENKRYDVVSCNERFLICTKAFNLSRGMVLYTIVDLVKKIRGTNNLIFNNFDYATKEGCDNCLLGIQKGEVEISKRNFVELEIENVFTTW